MDIPGMQKSLLDALLAGDRDEANILMDQASLEGGYRQAVDQVLEPVLVEIGRRWEGEKISLAVGYLAGKVAEDALLKCAAKEEGAPEEKGPVVIGNILDDFHSLGRRLVITFLRIAGWKVVDLGNDVEPAAFVDAAVAEGAPIIGASAMMLSTARTIAHIREELDRRGLSGKIKLAVGGAVFKMRPSLVDEVGADGTASTAAEVPALFELLSGLGSPA